MQKRTYLRHREVPPPSHPATVRTRVSREGIPAVDQAMAACSQSKRIEPACHPPDKSDRRVVLLADVALIAGEELVSAVAGERNLDMLARFAGDHIGGHAGGIGKWLVIVRSYFGYLVAQVRVNEDLGMVRTILIRHAACEGQLTQLCPKAHGERFDARSGVPSHEGNHSAGIDAAR